MREFPLLSIAKTDAIWSSQSGSLLTFSLQSVHTVDTQCVLARTWQWVSLIITTTTTTSTDIKANFSNSYFYFFLFCCSLLQQLADSTCGQTANWHWHSSPSVYIRNVLGGSSLLNLNHTTHLIPHLWSSWHSHCSHCCHQHLISHFCGFKLKLRGRQLRRVEFGSESVEQQQQPKQKQKQQTSATLAELFLLHSHVCLLTRTVFSLSLWIVCPV